VPRPLLPILLTLSLFPGVGHAQDAGLKPLQGRWVVTGGEHGGNGTQSCATCHVQSLAFTDGRARGLGSTGEEHSRSPMSLVNVAYRDTLTCAHPSLRSLEDQALVPMLGACPSSSDCKATSGVSI
jgi:hypothetical protein